MNRPTGIYLNNINKKSFCNKNLHLYLKGSLNIERIAKIAYFYNTLRARGI